MNEQHGEIRCACNRLLMKIENQRLEMICPRCKRKVIVDFSGIATEASIRKRIRMV
ncbi:hypothetical protein JXA80_02685 [bacterium]|nr:hypothetical protein [candidate division CSSED10-310 bacterium]